MLLPRSLRFRYTLRALLVFAWCAAAPQGCGQTPKKMPVNSGNATQQEVKAPTPIADARQVSEPVVKDGLSLTISLDKRVYQPGEEIKLHFTLKNETEKDIFIGAGALAPERQDVGLGGHFELLAVDEHKTELRFRSNAPLEGYALGARKVFKLRSQETYQGTICIAGTSTTTDGVFEAGDQNRRYVLGKDGKQYALTLRYQVNPKTHGVWKPPPDFSDERLWKGVLDSNVISFGIRDD